MADVILSMLECLYMAYNFKTFEKDIASIIERFEGELATVRTGRATPSILDTIFVEVYGARMPISQVATISVEGARTLRVSPWDASNAKEVEKAISVANLGLSVGADDKGIRVSFPDLTSERRVALIKIAKEKMEEVRQSLRGARDRVWTEIQQLERDGEMPEDDKFRAKDTMQKMVDSANAQFETMLERKEKEIAL